MGWQWHQLDHMQKICTLLQTDNHASTPPLSFLQTGCPSWRPCIASTVQKFMSNTSHNHSLTNRKIIMHRKTILFVEVKNKSSQNQRREWLQVTDYNKRHTWLVITSDELHFRRRFCKDSKVLITTASILTVPIQYHGDGCSELACVTYRYPTIISPTATRHRASTSTRWHFAFGTMLSQQRNPCTDCKSVQ